MQRLATRVFIGSSVLFGVLGVIAVFTADDNGETALMRPLFAVGFVVLSSFALSVAGKYLGPGD